MDDEYIIQMKNVVKQFPGVLALDHVDLEVKKGEVLAIIGENGAGKSTLMKVLSGAYRQDSGDIILGGEPVSPLSSPKERMDIGIAIIYQELNYLNEMTIAENLFMDRVPVKGMLKQVDYAKMKKDTEALMRSFNLNHHPFTPVRSLTVAEKQMVEILRAVSRDIKVVVMDEPTSSLNETETKRLFGFISDLKKQGVSVIYISHKLDEVFTIADRVQVMRDGKNVAVLEIKDTDISELVTLMVGRTITDMYPKGKAAIGEPTLEVENLSCSIARNISFAVNRGEILGMFGLVGSGRTEVVEGLLGIKSCEVGSIRIDGREVHINNPLDAKKHGIAYIPSDRKQDGLVAIHSVKDNITVTILDELRRGFAIDRTKERRYCDEWIERVKVKTPSRDTLVESLSGGNQQKVVITKWLLTDPKVLIMNDPTRGIDVGAKVEIYKIMESLCQQGISIIMVSSELPETMGITDRMLVFSDGRIVGEVARDDYEQREILNMAVGGV